MKTNQLSRTLTISAFSLFLLVFALVPFVLMLVISFMSHAYNQPIIWQPTLENYRILLSPIFFQIVARSLLLATFTTLVCLIIAYPFALFLSQVSLKRRPILLLLLIIPFWTSSLIRTYAILTLIKAKGLINTALLAMGIIHQPLQILYTNAAVIIGLVYNLLPYMILPLYTNMEQLDQNLINAARDLGANRRKILMDITLPLTLPGIIAGITLVFLPAMTLFYIPDILGGAKSLLLGNLVENQFLDMNNWSGGAATSIILTVFMLIILIFYHRTHRDKQQPGIF